MWAFLKELRPGQRLSGTVAAIERFGVFVALDEGPDHPVFPGVGFITMPELTWRWFQDPSEVISVGQYITCELLAFDTSNGEARLSLRATQPDPFRQFADHTRVGQVVDGTVTQLVPFGAFVRLADGIEGLLHSTDDNTTPGAPSRTAVEVGDHVSVTIAAIDLQRRRVAVSRPCPHVRP
ncbi:S1 RNA-binding domain-containing protein [Actinomadura yumaensis]|uniref:S1 RNA-binding domain-containing protein n=1 Tax=Actinomadura yumaensis TaxID=111807 RepID=UPI003614A59E